MVSIVIDCSHEYNFIGAFKEPNEWHSSIYFKGSPYEDLIHRFNTLIEQACISYNDIECFYLPCNPGSKLGIRLCEILANSIRILNHKNPKIFFYNGLYMTALALRKSKKSNNEKEYLITENGRFKWNCLVIDKKLKNFPEVIIKIDDELAQLKSKIYYMQQIKSWGLPKINHEIINYDPGLFLSDLYSFKDLYKDQLSIQKTINQYAKWHK